MRDWGGVATIYYTRYTNKDVSQKPFYSRERFVGRDKNTVPARNIRTGFRFEVNNRTVRATSDITQGKCKRTKKRLGNDFGCVLTHRGSKCLHLGWDEPVRGVTTTS